VAKISGLVVAHNEETHLENCLQTLCFVDELVVVLDKCTDNSKAIAQKFTKHIHEGSWDLECDRRNFGLSKCSSDWVIELDADERVPETLGQEICQVVKTSTADYHPIKVDNYIGQKLVRYGWGAYIGKSKTMCLSRAGKKEWGDGYVHPSVHLTGTEGHILQTPLDHYVDDNFSDLVLRFNGYTSANAKSLVEQNKIASLASDFRRIFTRFFKCFVMRKGYKEGGHGFIVAVFAGLYPFMSNLKARYDLKQG